MNTLFIVPASKYRVNNSCTHASRPKKLRCGLKPRSATTMHKKAAAVPRTSVILPAGYIYHSPLKDVLLDGGLKGQSDLVIPIYPLVNPSILHHHHHHHIPAAPHTQRFMRHPLRPCCVQRRVSGSMGLV